MPSPPQGVLAILFLFRFPDRRSHNAYAILIEMLGVVTDFP